MYITCTGTSTLDQDRRSKSVDHWQWYRRQYIWLQCGNWWRHHCDWCKSAVRPTSY